MKTIIAGSRDITDYNVDGASPGTRSMIILARKEGLHVFIYEV